MALGGPCSGLGGSGCWAGTGFTGAVVSLAVGMEVVTVVIVTGAVDVIGASAGTGFDAEVDGGSEQGTIC